MRESDVIRLRHMLEAAEAALAIARDKPRAALLNDMTSTLAVMKALEIIGEAANKLSAELRSAEERIPWSDIIGMRNVLVHAYFDVDLRVVWDTVERDLPGMAEELRRLLSRE